MARNLTNKPEKSNLGTQSSNLPDIDATVTGSSTGFVRKAKSIVTTGKQILSGVHYYANPTEYTETIATKREAICKGCPYLTTNGDTEGIGKYTCKKCGCLMMLKWRSMKSTCPINKWGAELSHDEHTKAQINKK